jgi:hypothetical protein
VRPKCQEKHKKQNNERAIHMNLYRLTLDEGSWIEREFKASGNIEQDAESACKVMLADVPGGAFRAVGFCQPISPANADAYDWDDVLERVLSEMEAPTEGDRSGHEPAGIFTAAAEAQEPEPTMQELEGRKFSELCERLTKSAASRSETPKTPAEERANKNTQRIIAGRFLGGLLAAAFASLAAALGTDMLLMDSNGGILEKSASNGIIFITFFGVLGCIAALCSSKLVALENLIAVRLAGRVRRLRVKLEAKEK